LALPWIRHCLLFVIALECKRILMTLLEVRRVRFSDIPVYKRKGSVELEYVHCSGNG